MRTTNGTTVPTQEAVNLLAKKHFAERPTTKELMEVWPDDWYSISYLKKIKAGISIGDVRSSYGNKSKVNIKCECGSKAEHTVPNRAGDIQLCHDCYQMEQEMWQ